MGQPRERQHAANFAPHIAQGYLGRRGPFDNAREKSLFLALPRCAKQCSVGCLRISQQSRHQAPSVDEPKGWELRAAEIICRRIPNAHERPIPAWGDIHHRLIPRDLSACPTGCPIGMIHPDFARGDNAGHHRYMPLRVAAGALKDQYAARLWRPGTFILPGCRLPPLPGIAADAEPRTLPRIGRAGQISAGIARHARTRPYAPRSAAGKCEQQPYRDHASHDRQPP